MEYEQLMTKREFAIYMNVSEGTIDKWMRAGKVRPERTPGGAPRFRKLVPTPKEE